MPRGIDEPIDKPMVYDGPNQLVWNPGKPFGLIKGILKGSGDLVTDEEGSLLRKINEEHKRRQGRMGYEPSVWQRTANDAEDLIRGAADFASQAFPFTLHYEGETEEQTKERGAKHAEALGRSVPEGMVVGTATSFAHPLDSAKSSPLLTAMDILPVAHPIVKPGFQKLGKGVKKVLGKTDDAIKTFDAITPDEVIDAELTRFGMGSKPEGFQGFVREELYPNQPRAYREPTGIEKISEGYKANVVDNLELGDAAPNLASDLRSAERHADDLKRHYTKKIKEAPQKGVREHKKTTIKIDPMRSDVSASKSGVLNTDVFESTKELDDLIANHLEMAGEDPNIVSRQTSPDFDFVDPPPGSSFQGLTVEATNRMNQLMDSVHRGDIPRQLADQKVRDFVAQKLLGEMSDNPSRQKDITAYLKKIGYDHEVKDVDFVRPGRTGDRSLMTEDEFIDNVHEAKGTKAEIDEVRRLQPSEPTPSPASDWLDEEIAKAKANLGDVPDLNEVKRIREMEKAARWMRQSYKDELEALQRVDAKSSESEIGRVNREIAKDIPEQMGEHFEKESLKSLGDHEGRHYTHLWQPDAALDAYHNPPRLLTLDGFKKAEKRVADAIGMLASEPTHDKRHVNILMQMLRRLHSFREIDYRGQKFKAPVEVAKALEIEEKARHGLGEGAIQAINQTMKSGMTSRSVPSAISNTMGNLILQSVRRSGDLPTMRRINSRFLPLNAALTAVMGPVGNELGAWIRDAYDMRNRAKLKDPYDRAKFEALSLEGLDVSNQVSRELQGGVASLLAQSKNPVVRGVAKFGEIVSAPLEWLYKIGDQLAKISEASRVYDSVWDDIMDQKPGQWTDYRGRDGSKVRVTTIDDDTISVKIGSKERTIREDSPQMARLVASIGAEQADRNFFDYARTNRWAKKLRYAPIIGIASPFYSFASLSMDLPGKKGLLSHATTGPDYVLDRSNIRMRDIADGMAKTIKRTAINSALVHDLREGNDRQIINNFKSWPDQYKVAVVRDLSDPGYIQIDNFGNWDSFGATETILMGLATLGAMNEHGDVDPRVPMSKEARALTHKIINKEMLTAADVTQLIGIGGGMLHNALRLADEGSDPGEPPTTAKMMKMLGKAFLGATNYNMMDAALSAKGKYVDSFAGDDPDGISKAAKMGSYINQWAKPHSEEQDTFGRWVIRMFTSLGWNRLSHGKPLKNIARDTKMWEKSAQIDLRERVGKNMMLNGQTKEERNAGKNILINAKLDKRMISQEVLRIYTDYMGIMRSLDPSVTDKDMGVETPEDIERGRGSLDLPLPRDVNDINLPPPPPL